MVVGQTWGYRAKIALNSGVPHGASTTLTHHQSLVSPIGFTKQPPLTFGENILSAIFTMANVKTPSLLYEISSVDSWSD